MNGNVDGNGNGNGNASTGRQQSTFVRTLVLRYVSFPFPFFIFPPSYFCTRVNKKCTRILYITMTHQSITSQSTITTTHQCSWSCCHAAVMSVAQITSPSRFVLITLALLKRHACARQACRGGGGGGDTQYIWTRPTRHLSCETKYVQEVNCYLLLMRTRPA